MISRRFLGASCWLFLLLVVANFPALAGTYEDVIRQHQEWRDRVLGRVTVRAPASSGLQLPESGKTYGGTYSGPNGPVAKGAIKGTIGGKPITIGVDKLLTPATVGKVLKTATRFIGPLSLGFGLAGLLWDDLQKQWMKPGAPVEDVTTYPPGKWKFGNFYGPTPVEPCQAYCTSMGYTFKSAQLTSPTSFRCYYNSQYSPGGTLVYSCPAGTRYDMTTNLCRAPNTGAPTPVTETEMEEKIKSICETSPDNCWKTVTANIPAPNPNLYDDAPEPETSGPASIQGPTTVKTTTTPTGTTTVTTTTVWNISYSGPDVNIDQRKTIITCNEAGSCTTIIEDDDSDETPKDGEISIETEFPDSPNDVNLVTQELNLDYAPTMSAAGSCPAPITISYLGRTYLIKYDLVCDFARGLRPFLIIVASIGAGLMIFASARRMT